MKNRIVANYRYVVYSKLDNHFTISHATHARINAVLTTGQLADFFKKNYLYISVDLTDRELNISQLSETNNITYL